MSIVDKIKSRFIVEKNLVGIDIGISSIKVAQLSGNESSGNFNLIRYASVPLPEGAIIDNEVHDKDIVIDVIKSALKEANISETYACVGIFGNNTAVKRLQIAGGNSPEEIEDQVAWDIGQHISFDSYESSLSVHVVGESKGGGMNVIAGIAKEDVVDNYRAIVEEAGLKVKIVDLNLIAATNVLTFVESERLNSSEETFLYLNIGAQITDLVLYREGVIVFSKEINYGGLQITEEIQRQVGVNYVEAEELKIYGDGDGNIPEEVLSIIEDVLEQFFSEVKKTIEFYSTSSSDNSISVCYISGGGAMIQGLIERLQAALSLEIIVLDMFSKIKYNKKFITEEMLPLVSYSGVTAVGLAMRRG